MTRFQDIPFASSPFVEFMASTKGVPVVAQFRAARLLGYVTDEALRGRYQQSGGQQQRAAGNTARKWPAVPLSGDIVSAFPRKILEWYETITTYRNTTASREHMRILRHSHSGVEIWRPFELRAGDETFAYRVIPIRLPHQPQGEWGYGLDIRTGPTVLQLGIWGGRRVTLQIAIAYAKEALATLSAACGH